MKRCLTSIACLLLLLPAATAQVDTVLQRYRAYMLQSLPRADVQPWIHSLSPAQQWADLNYRDVQPANWKVSRHLERVRFLALAWADPASPYYRRQALWETISRALDHWLQHRYRCVNWWHNEIGVPQYMRDIIILTRERLSPRQLSGALEVLAQHRVKGTGANLTWSADLGFHYGALRGDTALMRLCSQKIAQEISTGGREGIQPDFSFHQHGPRLQQYQYGAAFLADNVRLAWELQGTPWVLPAKKTALLTGFVLNGWQWMARGLHTVPGTIDRAVSRMNALHAADLRRYIPYLCALSPAQAPAFTAIRDRQNGNGAPLEGFRYFPWSDFAAWHTPGFSLFVKTLSDRTLPTESINNENLKGRLLHSGDAYLVRDGQEYFNMMPVWDWRYLPGITVFDSAFRAGRKPFTGSVGSGSAGLTVMNYRMEDRTGEKFLTARKSWFCHGNVTVCLIAGLQASKGIGDVFTALDQCRWRTPVTVGGANGLQTPAAGLHRLEQVQWIHHAGFAYILLQPAAIQLKLDTVSGSWSSVNASITAPPVTDKVFLPLLQHHLPAGAATGYVLAGCPEPADAAALAARPGWQVLRNDSACQAVAFANGDVMCAFYAPGALQLAPGRTLEANRPCLMMIADGKLYASDPAHTGGTVRGSWQGRPFDLQLPADGSTISR